MQPLYVAFTAAMLVAAALCLRDARGDRADVALLGAALAYGIVLEKATIVAFEAYTYPAEQYLVAPLDIPLAIGLGWAAVIYAGVATARGLGVPRVSFPGFVALYALHIDLAMDAVAIRVPYWVWTPPGPWFGVPYGNFFGWFTVALLLPAWYLGLERRLPRPEIRAPTALVLSVASLIPLLEGWVRFTAGSQTLKLAVLVGAGTLAAAILLARPPAFDGDVPTAAFGASLVFHLFFLALIFVGGYYRARPGLVVLSLSMLALGVGVHRLPRVVRS
ncbi:MAG: carotenoid biosynthesis protein [Halobacteriaceae archaeon]